MYSLLSSYLSNRSQYVALGDDKSNCLPNDIGVPQGSCLGPLLFILYINDIIQLIENALSILFADDTSFVLKNKNINTLGIQLNYILYKVDDWCRFNKLVLNVNKTKIMLFNARNRRLPIISLGENKVEIVQQFKYLGFILDNKLSHTFHIRHLISKLKRLKAITYRVGKFLTLGTAKTFYHAMVHSHLGYGTLVWGGTLNTAGFRRLQNLQDKILKNLFFHHLPQENLYKRMNILRICDIYKVKAGLAMYSCLHQGSYSFMYNFINNLTRNHLHNTRYRNNFRLPIPRKKAIKLNFIYQAIKVWNDLDYDLRRVDSFDQFESELYKNVFDSY